MNDQKQEIPDDKLIHEPKNAYKGLFLFLISFIIMFIAIIFGSRLLKQQLLKNEYQGRPFLQVTNREISLMLWQFPGFMRSNVKRKTGYLPGFEYIDTNMVNPLAADQIAAAPPELLFLYHTWNRLIQRESTPRPIIAQEFIEFLENDEEWQPKYWKDAPKNYSKFVASLPDRLGDDLQKAPETIFPLKVRQAFHGWKNYFKEGELINALKPTYGQVKQFLTKHPHYSRNFWRNISEIKDQPIAGLLYLESWMDDNNLREIKNEQLVNPNEISPFLKVALFNFLEAQRSE